MTERSHPTPSPPRILVSQILLSGALLCLTACSTAAASHDFSFAEDRVTCTVTAPEANEIPPDVLSSIPLAMKIAIQEVGQPATHAHLSIRLKGAPGFRERIRGLFHPEIFAIQEGDELRMHVPEDPLKLTFRIAHEASHWLVAQQFPSRPPLWLDEGLAQAVGATAASAAARTRSQQLERPQPVRLLDAAYTLEELTALTRYPDRKAQVAAFYWQAEALTQALRKKLGKEAFAEYLALLSSPEAPDWQVPLRTRWYFNDGDMDWLSRQIQPTKLPSTP